MTDEKYDFKEYCSCMNDELCQEKTERVYCIFDGDMVQGTEFVQGQYTYRYRQAGVRSSDGLAWNNFSKDGWEYNLLIRIVQML